MVAPTTLKRQQRLDSDRLDMSLYRRILLCSLLVVHLLAGCKVGGQTPSASPPTMAYTVSSPTVSASATPTIAATTMATPTEAPPTPVSSKLSEMPATPTASLASPTSTVTTAPTASLASPTNTASTTPTSTPTAVVPTPTPPPVETSVTQTTVAVPGIDVIVDNQDPAFSTTGAWFIGDGGQSYDGDCVWAPRGVQNVAYVQPELPMAGAYEVFAWWCGDPNHDQSQRALIQVYPDGERVAPYQVYVNLQENAGQWNSLGTYYLEPDGSLSIHSYLDGNVVADAFRFVYRSPEHIVITPTPMPTPIPWTGHPPTPLEQLTSGDLSIRLGLVQRFYPHTPITSMETAAFDDCQAFPRDGCSGAREGWRVQVQYQDMVVRYRVSQDYRFVAVEPPDALASRQLLYLYGTQDNRFFRVDHYPDDTWHLSGADFERTYASHLPLDAETVETLRSFVQTYSSVTFETPAGIKLQLYGLGERVELSEEDRSRLATLGAELVAAVW